MPTAPLAAGFMVIHGNQPELLRQLLVHWYRAHPLAPLEDEAILVQSNGIAQWLKLALAADADSGCGIAAALDMLLPSRFVWQAYRAVLGRDAVPDASPFDKPLLIWRLMRLLPALLARPEYAPLARFLTADDDLRKRYQLAEKIADLFDQYQVYRADWLQDWAAGDDAVRDARGEARPLADEQRWQAALWRALLADVGAAGQSSRAAVHSRFLAAAAGLTEPPPGLPRRVIVFGLSSLPRQSLEVLLAISRCTQVILCVHNPSELYWADLLSAQDHARHAAKSRRHARKAGLPAAVADEELHLYAHPLLAAWGKQGRDYIALLDELDDPERYRAHFARLGERIDIFESHLTATPRLLNQLQEDIRLLRPLAETRAAWPPLDPAGDPSLRFHVAHSPQREVEILHDQLLAAFDADPTLKPRDVIVMVPDVNQYAPHIQAVFGQIDTADARHIPYSIADLARRQQAPLALALEFLLGAAESRLAVSDLLDLLDVPALRQRFAIAESDLPLLRRWIAQTHIRWGLDAGHRRQFIAGDYEQNTWLHGLKRMLLGYAVGADPSGRADDDWHGIEPYAEVAGLDAALVGPLAQLLGRLAALGAECAQAAPPSVWHERLQALLRDFFAASADEDSLLLLQLHASLRDWAEACAAAGLVEPLPLAVVREHWLTEIDRGTLAQRFLAGRLTFATLMPMRAIPFRMICLLGMNDGDYPRSRPPLDFDLMARDLRPGDRSRREDDRYLFLEALLSARQRLHISWVGRSIHDNSERPPSVLVSQLRDHLDAGWRLAGGEGGVSAALTVHHPLQPFSTAYFSAASPLFTYAREWEARPAAATAPETAPLPPPTLEAPLSFKQLADFLNDPIKTFFTERLGVHFDAEDLSAEDHEPFALDGLQQWDLQNQLIRARLDALLGGEDESAAVERTLARIRRRGELPFGRLADLLADDLRAPLDAMFAQYRAALAEWPQRLADRVFRQRLEIAGQSVAVEGRIERCYAAGGERCRIELVSRDLIDKQHYRRDRLFAAWVVHLACHVAGEPTTTLLIGKNGQVRLAPLSVDAATRQFAALVEAYVAGLASPLPLAPRTGFAWLEKLGKGADEAAKAARSRYEDGFNSSGEAGRSPYRLRVYPDFATLAADGRFAELCERLLTPLAAAVGQSAGETER